MGLKHTQELRNKNDKTKGGLSSSQ